MDSHSDHVTLPLLCLTSLTRHLARGDPTRPDHFHTLQHHTDLYNLSLSLPNNRQQHRSEERFKLAT
jgi:hypothetical protein